MQQHYRCSWLLESPIRLILATLLSFSLFYGLYVRIDLWIRSHHVKFGIEVTERPNQGIVPIGLTIDSKSLKKNFPKLKNATKKHTWMNHNQLNQTMTSYLPVVDTSAWVPHSPSGKEFSIDEVHFLAKSTIQRGFLVPNIAHFVLPFTETNLRFHHMVSLLSCLNVMKPHRLLLWYSNGKLPSGQWWDRVRNNLTDSDWEERIIFVQRPIPTSVYTVPVHGKEHQSDVMRLEAVLIFGGVYMDIDVLVLKSLEPLRKYPCTIGRELPYGLCNGIFMSAPGGTFLAMWHTAYQVFNDNAWGDHSVELPSTMQAAFPDLCHVEEESMDRPNWTPREANWIYGIGQQGKWDWRRKNYAMHLWFRKYGKQHNMDNIKTLDSMYGEMCRFILYGNRGWPTDIIIQYNSSYSISEGQPEITSFVG